MKTCFKNFSLVTAVCALLIVLPQTASAVTDDDFAALKDLVTKQGQRLDQLEKQHEQDQATIEQTRKQREQDQAQIQQLKQQLSDTQQTATNAQQVAASAQEAAAAAKVEVPPNSLAPNPSHNFTMVGDAEVQFGKVDGQHSAFVMADFAPIFLFRGGDKTLMEVGFDVTLQNGGAPLNNGASTAVDLSFAQLDYVINDYLTFVGGLDLLPLGTYSERSAGWLNKIPDAPMARDFLPGAGVGAMLRGALPLGDAGQSLHYSAYVVNGPSSIDGSGTAANLDLGGNVGITSDGRNSNLHGWPSAGGRIGWFYPWKAHGDVELGLSGQSGTWDSADRLLWSSVNLDAAVHIGPFVEIKGEYIYSMVETDDLGTVYPHGWWIQAGYKLVGLDLEVPYINNLELVGRFDNARDITASRADRYTLGFVYYLTSSLLVEGDYEFRASDNPDPTAPEHHNLFVFQLSYGF
jgi:hypothetical protein